jgi:hypothetical protein
VHEVVFRDPGQPPARPTTVTVELECIRADEIQRSGAIDLPMHEWLKS